MPTHSPSSPTLFPNSQGPPGAASPRGPTRLLGQLRLALRSRHYSKRTEQAYCLWVRRFVRFHDLRHPAEMAEPEINAFLTHLAVSDEVSASTQNQALSALLFLYRHVLDLFELRMATVSSAVLAEITGGLSCYPADGL